MAPDEAIRRWIRFAGANKYLRVSGNRSFGSDLEKVETLIEEEEALFAFCRSESLGLPERVQQIIAGSPSPKSGAEHKVFFDADTGRVIKVTFPGKYGRREHTPFQYLERLHLLNEMTPAVVIRFVDCIRTANGQFSIVSTMQFFAGPYPAPQEIEFFVKSLGFVSRNDGSTTLDFVNFESKLIIRDCHARNWIQTKKELVPIDIIPERLIVS